MKNPHHLLTTWTTPTRSGDSERKTKQPGSGKNSKKPNTTYTCDVFEVVMLIFGTDISTFFTVIVFLWYLLLQENNKPVSSSTFGSCDQTTLAELLMMTIACDFTLVKETKQIQSQ